MALPGVVVSSRSAPPPRGVNVDTGVWFVVGTAEKGSVTGAQLVRNMTEFQYYYGTRQSYSVLWDSLEAFFREGGTEAYVARAAGSSAATAGRTLNDSGAGASLRVDAKNPGAWGNSLSVAVIAGTGSGEFTLVVTHSTLGEVDRSPSLVDQSAAINWGRHSDWVSVSLPGSPTTNDPAVAAAAALSGGVDDNSGVTDNQRQAALSLFPRALGPGQVSMPGNTTSGNRTALIAHARANNRQALLDAIDSASRSALVTEAQALWGDEYGALFAPWITVPGVTPGTTRVVPPTAIVAGLMARADGQGSPNEPAAGDNGVSRFALDVSQPAWSDLDRQLLNEANSNILVSRPGGVVLYGYHTLARPSGDVSWLALNNQRLRMKITAEALQIGEGFMFDQIDGRGHKLAEFAGSLTGLLSGYYASGALYGATPDEAYNVDVGPSVNTPTTLSNNQMRAVLTLRMSPFAEQVVIEIVKVSITESV